ncbi:MAG: GCN5-related N-acetyltransferase [Methylobacterium sp.]|nr:MAG: GCN5-related N-acetyltransferase [Methylobacterium sp.]
MVDPMAALVSFQQAYKRGAVRTERGRVHPKILCHMDEPAPGVIRLTYVRTQGMTVTALCSFSQAGVHEGFPVFQAGVAVAEGHRGKGLAKHITGCAIDEIRNGFASTPMEQFWIEAIVSRDNHASNAVATSVISEQRMEMIDEASGQPAYQYMVLVKSGR